ncbi:MAG: DUF4097 family beta strand repeat-containing protein [Clostridia bacterium]
MKAATKKLIIIALALVGIGTALALIALVSVDFNYSAFDTQPPYEQKKYTYAASKVTGIDVSTCDTSVMIKSGSGEDINITCFENSIETYDIGMDEDGTLRVEYVQKQDWRNNIGINFGQMDKKLIITLPAELAGMIDVNTTSGDIELNGVSAQKDIRLQASSGDITFGGLSAAGFLFKTSSGCVRGDITGDVNEFCIDADTSSGEIDVPRASNGTKRIAVSTSSGDIDIDITANIDIKN